MPSVPLATRRRLKILPKRPSCACSARREVFGSEPSSLHGFLQLLGIYVLLNSAAERDIELSHWSTITMRGDVGVLELNLLMVPPPRKACCNRSWSKNL